MTIHRPSRLFFITLMLGLPTLIGCDFDNHPTATGKTVTRPETKSVEDPGTVNAGGPGAQGQTPK